MLFGVKLANEVYPPWKKEYIAYERLKKLLKESVVGEDGEEEDAWSEADESRFVSALDQELEKVYSFENATYEELSARVNKLELQTYDDDADKAKQIESQAMEREIEDIMEVTTQLDRFSRLNYTGFVKIVKKHDRLHPQYQVKPLLHVRLSALPFHNEDYSPLLYRLSGLYNVLSDNFSTSVAHSASARISSFQSNTSDFQIYKFWVHPENVMEVKTKILRHLPVLVYNQENAGQDGDRENTDPTITSLYFDNSSFELYESELERKRGNQATPSLRLRWYGNLQDRPDIILERKDSDTLQIKLKEKYIEPFLNGDDNVVQKLVKKLKDRKSLSENEVQHFQNQVLDLQAYIKGHRLSPVLRTIYTRTAFQIPRDDQVRVILDSNISFIREDCFNADRPIRDPDSWKRNDLDLPGVPNDLSRIRKSEYTKFPYSVLELRVKNNPKSNAWVEELTSSHLVKQIPQFSKFVQGVASLFAEDDRLDALPFWLPDLEHDIRQDPKEVYKQQQEKIGYDSTARSNQRGESSQGLNSSSNDDSSDDDGIVKKGRKNRVGFPARTNTESRLDQDSEDEEFVLPPGVVRPTSWLRNQGQVKVETKVWLANERTFNKWLSVTVLLSATTFALYNSVERSVSTPIAEKVAYVLFALTLFSGIWGYYIYMQRLNFIRQRSELHLDNPFGPVVIALTLFVSLTLNFYLSVAHRKNGGAGMPGKDPLHR